MIFDSGRPHIAIVGRRNVGKSLLINSLLKQNVSRVSEVAGTTIDPLKTKFELLPYGPVMIVDTAGIDDEGELGRQRITETIKILSASDFALVVLDARETLHSKELELFSYLDRIQINYVVVVNKIEFGVNPVLLKELKELRLTHFEVSCKEKAGLDELKRRMIRMLPLDSEKPLINDIISARDVVVLTVPNDNSLPKNKLAFSQVHIIREALDDHAVVVICREKELLKTINNLKSYPDLVIADSSFFKKIIQDIPDKISFTTFSIILSRHKGDLPLFIRGLKKINDLKNGDRILIAEACTHHIIDDAQDSIKIPKWLKAYTKKELNIDIVQSYNLPDNLSEYKLIVHCGGCLLTHRSMQTRINQARLMDVSVVNYGMINSFIDGAIPRGLIPFPEAAAEWEKT
ncbi:MAG: [FeFe] hydrogenase H-cluster maturation GTPase HydF [Ignavibacterium sp.]|nr:[FeFe] hydrogenase H-cluster maturation GTPase HydF [Ignavibacterium sp.]